MPTKLSMTSEATFCFKSYSVARAFDSAPLVIALLPPAFMDFAAFMAFIAFMDLAILIDVGVRS